MRLSPGQALASDDKFLLEAARRASARGGRLLIVGGRARDIVGAYPPEAGADLDLVAFGLSREALGEIFAPLGREIWRGRGRAGAGAVPLRALRVQGEDWEASAPQAGEGAAPLPWTEWGLRADALRRDFTVNAIYIDPLTREVKDPLGGLKDIAAKSLFPVSPASLKDDPLRALRAMTLVSKGKLTAHPRLLKDAREFYPLLKEVPRERLWREWRLWAQSPRPSLGLRFLRESGLINFFPELEALLWREQGWAVHAEGSVWNHSVLALQALEESALPPGAPQVALRLATLLHDVGKGLVAPVLSPLTGKATYYPDHAAWGVKGATAFLRGIGAPSKTIRPVRKLIARHMDLAFKTPGAADLRAIGRYLAPEANLADFWAVVAADWNGRSPWPERFPWSLEEFLEPVGGAAGVRPSPLKGGEIMEALKIPAGPRVGKIKKALERAHDLGQIESKEEALALARKIALSDGRAAELKRARPPRLP
ncbi:MAG: hypothetical protein LBO66_13025 [Deltaproteobacteria bacterium]|jgi:tRNA nucleotidyltransferase/poly(A) polymerase|nr:hypothetical protein [Deltaproteobacteria bacterium]